MKYGGNGVMKFNKFLLLTLAFLTFAPREIISGEYFYSLKNKLSKYIQENPATFTLGAGAFCASVYYLWKNYNQKNEKVFNNQNFEADLFIASGLADQIIDPKTLSISPSAPGLGLIPETEKVEDEKKQQNEAPKVEPKKEEPKKLEPKKNEQPMRGSQGKLKKSNDGRSPEIASQERKKEADDNLSDSFVDVDEKAGAEFRMSADQAYADIKEDADRKMKEDNNYKEITTEELQQFCDSLNNFFQEINYQKNLQKILELSANWNFYNTSLAKALMHPGTKEIWQRKLNQNMNALKELFEDKNQPWKKGQNLVRNIMAGKLIEFKDVKEYLTAVRNLMWYLYPLAVQKREAFQEGTFVIIDPNFRILHFLNSYFKGYDRSGKWSSHFREFDGIYTKGALDVLPEFRDELYFPPYNQDKKIDKYHIFFGKTGDNRFFIKPESYGLDFMNDIWSALGHLLEWYHSIIAKFSFGADDKDHMRKERVENHVSKMWNDLVHKVYKNKHDDPELLDDINQVKLHGIQKIKEIIETKQIYNDHKDFVNNFLTTLNYDNLSIRKGREVILTEEDIDRGITINWPTLPK